MRAINGAIITAAALIGLGLTAQGIGTRYSLIHINKPAAQEGSASEGPNLHTQPDFERMHVRFRDLDNPMQLCLVVLILAALIGLGITFVGLMYHHHRRFHEHLRLHGQPNATTSHHVTN